MDDFFDLILGPEDDSDDEDKKEDISNLSVDKNRQLMKERLGRTLKTQYFFDDNELKVVFMLMDKYFVKIDELNNSVDASNYGLISSQKMEIDLLTIQKAMLRDIKELIKTIMRAKVEEAKEFFKNREKNTANNPTNNIKKSHNKKRS